VPVKAKLENLSSNGQAGNLAASARANGRVVARTGGFFPINSEGTKIHPGDTMVVPLGTERLPSRWRR
jgi:hypothetical protein